MFPLYVVCATLLLSQLALAIFIPYPLLLRAKGHISLQSSFVAVSLNPSPPFVSALQESNTISLLPDTNSNPCPALASEVNPSKLKLSQSVNSNPLSALPCENPPSPFQFVHPLNTNPFTIEITLPEAFIAVKCVFVNIADVPLAAKSMSSICRLELSSASNPTVHP